jgi:hypothetical protein
MESDGEDTLHKINRRMSSRIGHGLKRNSPPKTQGKIGVRIKVAEDEKGELSSYWINLRKVDTANLKKKH